MVLNKDEYCQHPPEFRVVSDDGTQIECGLCQSGVHYDKVPLSEENVIKFLMDSSDFVLHRIIGLCINKLA